MARVKGKNKKTTKDLQKEVIAAFEETGNITAACKKVRVPRRTFYNWLKKPAFEKMYNEALPMALGVLEDEARRRAVDGTLKPVFYKGQPVGKIREYSDTLLIVLLKAHAPAKYKEKGPYSPDEDNPQPTQKLEINVVHTNVAVAGREEDVV
jgi:hypothetical protein